MGGEYDREAEEAYKELAIRTDAETKKRVVKLQVSRNVELGLSLVTRSLFFRLSHDEVLLSAGPCCVHNAVHVRRRPPCRDVPRRKSVEWLKGADHNCHIHSCTFTLAYICYRSTRTAQAI